MTDQDRLAMFIRALLFRDVGLSVIQDAIDDARILSKCPNDNVSLLSEGYAERLLGKHS